MSMQHSISPFHQFARDLGQLLREHRLLFAMGIVVIASAFVGVGAVVLSAVGLDGAAIAVALVGLPTVWIAGAWWIEGRP